MGPWIPSLVSLLATPTHAVELEAPIEIVVGPSLLYLGGRRLAQQRANLHTGVVFDFHRVLSEKEIRENRIEASLPVEWHVQSRITGEIQLQLTPIDWLVPRDVVVSPWPDRSSHMFGASWRFFSLGYQLVSGYHKATAHVSIAPRLSIYTLRTGDLDDTLFVRPGADVEMQAQFRLTPSLRLLVAGSAQFYVPQRLGGPPLQLGPGEQASLWFIAQPWAALAIRFPSKIRFRGVR